MAFAEPRLREHAARLEQEHILPLESKAEALDRCVVGLSSNVSAASTDVAALRTEFEDMSGDILALRQFFNARRGDREGYEGLVVSAQRTNATLAPALLQDIREFYRDFKNETQGKEVGRWGRQVVHIKTLDYYRSSAEGLQLRLTHKDSYQRQAEVNETARRGMKYFVEDLVGVVTNDSNVLVASRAVSAIESLTGKSFGDVPPWREVSRWWHTEGHTNPIYASPFALLREADRLRQNRRFDEALACYQQALTNRSGLGISHYYVGLIHKAKGDPLAAYMAFKRATEEADGLWEAAFEYAISLVQDKKYAEAVAELKKVKPYYREDFAAAVKRHPAFVPLHENEQFKELWQPSQ